MSNELKNKMLKYKGTVSQQEVDYIKNLLPKTNIGLSSLMGSISDNEMEYLKKMLPKKGIK
jgi:hypothetical protein|tara:strand:- start:317 stop:499 length:183 start_codon:yes stop_codon:yes gene_type:complete